MKKNNTLSDLERNFASTLNHELNILGRGSRKSLAEALGVPQSTLSGWITGARCTREEERRKISDILGMDYEAMINSNHQTATARGSAIIAQTAGRGNTISVTRSEDLTPQEKELITALREYGNKEMILAIMARLAEIRRMSKFE